MFTSFQNKIQENRQLVIIIAVATIFTIGCFLIILFTDRSQQKTESNKPVETSSIDLASGKEVYEISNIEPETASLPENKTPSIVFVGFSSLYETLGESDYSFFRDTAYDFAQSLDKSITRISLVKNSISTDKKHNSDFYIVINNDMNDKYIVKYLLKTNSSTGIIKAHFEYYKDNQLIYKSTSR